METILHYVTPLLITASPHIDIGTGDHMVGEVDKWFEFDDEQMNLIEGHINILR